MLYDWIYTRKTPVSVPLTIIGYLRMAERRERNPGFWLKELVQGCRDELLLDQLRSPGRVNSGVLKSVVRL